jgi:excisionase family DNA binding protein
MTISEQLTDAQRRRLVMLAVARASIGEGATGADLVAVAEWIIGSTEPPTPAVQAPRSGPWTRQELAEYLGVSLATIDRWIANGEIDTVKVGHFRRITDEAVKDLLYRRRELAVDNQPRPGRKPKQKDIRP